MMSERVETDQSTSGALRSVPSGVALAAVLAALLVAGCAEPVEVLPDHEIDKSSLTYCEPEDGISFQEGEDLQAHADCELLGGSMTLRPWLDEEAAHLVELRVVEGNIGGPGFRSDAFSVTHFNRLEVIEGSLRFLSDEVISLEGLTALRRIDGRLSLRMVPALRDFRGLQNLRAVGELLIVHNDVLESLDGLSGLTHVRGDVTIRGNPRLSQDEVEAFVDRLQIGGEVKID